MPLLDPAHLVPRQPSKYLAEALSQLPVQHLSSALRLEHEMVVAVPFRVV